MALLAGCGGGGEGTMGDGSDQAFDTPRAVLKAAMATELAALLPVTPAPGAKVPSRAMACARNRAVVVESHPCTDGGSIRSARGVEIDAGSPFSDEPFLVSQTRYHHCVESSSSCSFYQYEETHGQFRTGCPESQWNDGICAFIPAAESRTDYWSFGTEAVPYTRTVRYGEVGHHTTVTTTEVSTNHQRSGAELPIENAMARRVEGTEQAEGEPPRSFRSLKGTPDRLYRTTSTVSATSGTVSMDGPLAVEHGNCRVGLFTVHTLEPITYAMPDGVVRLVSGSLSLENDLHQTATVTVRPEGLEVRDARGRVETFALDHASLREAIGDCLSDGADGGDDGGTGD